MLDQVSDLSRSENGATELLSEPLLGLFLADHLEVTEGAGSCSASGNSLAGSGEDNVEVHSVDTSGGIVLNSEIDVLIDTKAKVAYIIIKNYKPLSIGNKLREARLCFHL